MKLEGILDQAADLGKKLVEIAQRRQSKIDLIDDRKARREAAKVQKQRQKTIKWYIKRISRVETQLRDKTIGDRTAKLLIDELVKEMSSFKDTVDEEE